MQRQLVHEGPYQVVRGEVEHQSEEDGDGQGGKRLLEDGEEEEGQTQALRGETTRDDKKRHKHVVQDSKSNCKHGGKSPPVTHDEDGHEAGQRGVPVAAGGGGRLPHQHAVEDEVSEAQLHAP